MQKWKSLYIEFCRYKYFLYNQKVFGLAIETKLFSGHGGGGWSSGGSSGGHGGGGGQIIKIIKIVPVSSGGGGYGKNI